MHQRSFLTSDVWGGHVCQSIHFISFVCLFFKLLLDAWSFALKDAAKLTSHWGMALYNGCFLDVVERCFFPQIALAIGVLEMADIFQCCFFGLCCFFSLRNFQTSFFSWCQWFSKDLGSNSMGKTNGWTPQKPQSLRRKFLQNRLWVFWV